MYYVYLLRCEDGSLYTGITSDLQRRLAEHMGQSGRGAKYTRAHRPSGYAGTWTVEDKSAALRLEHRIKKLTHEQKQQAAASGRLPFDYDELL